MPNVPAQQSTSLRYLIRDLTRDSRFRALQACSQGDLFAGLRPVASLAAWICKFRPELGFESNLRIAIVGAEQEDTVDEGRWYGLLGYLLGNDELHTSVTFVGPSLYRFSGAQPVPTPTGIWRTSAARALAELGFQKANVREVDAGTFARTNEAHAVDLIVLFNPGFEDEQTHTWFEAGQLSGLCSLGKPVALTAYAEEEQVQDAYLARAWGFTPGDETAANPFVGMETPVGAWGQVLWMLQSGPADANFQPDKKMLERNRRYMVVAQDFLEETGMPFPAETGKLVAVQVQGASSALDTRAILLPEELDAGRAAVGVSSGLIYSVRKGAAVVADEMSAFVVPHEMLEMYDVEVPFCFEHVLWTIETMDWLGRRYQEAADEETSEMIRNFGGIDLEQMGTQVAALKRDPQIMDSPHMRALTDAMGSLTTMLEGLPDQMKQVLEQGNVSLPARKSFSPTRGAEAFFHAVESDNWSRASDLLQAHPEFAHALNRSGANAAMSAASANRVDFLDQLAKAGTDFDVQDDELFSPLHEAARRGFPEAVRILLKHGAQPDATNRFGWTPLLMALTSRMGSPVSAYSEVVLTLLNSGADARRKNMAGLSAASLADQVELNDAARQALKKS
ncbi:ankyrin repeat domain-containing protein [Burkholderia gladioli]|uniref:ankyrin repeat domain-containing protein n=1 Tax=Burkholderia gladioli TaxID=28095 RepID=UPI00163E4F13|nr:ankyrin repeat domain-containing protein [Burkholderia gladioli]